MGGGVMRRDAEAVALWDTATWKVVRSLPARLQSAWESIKVTTDPAASQAMHTALIADVRALITHVGDSSKLILDPDLDTYYTMDALLLREPEIMNELGTLDATVDKLPAQPNVDQVSGLASQVALLHYQLDALKVDMDTAFAETKNFNNNKDLQATLSPLVGRAVSATNHVADLTAAGVAPATYASAVRGKIDRYKDWLEHVDQ